MTDGKVIREAANAKIAGSNSMISAFDSASNIMVLGLPGNPTIHSYDVMSGKPVFSLDCSGPVSSFVFSVDSSYIVVGTTVGNINVVDTSSGELCLNNRWFEDAAVKRNMLIPQSADILTFVGDALCRWNLLDVLKSSSGPQLEGDHLHTQDVTSEVISADEKVIVTGKRPKA